MVWHYDAELRSHIASISDDMNLTEKVMMVATIKRPISEPALMFFRSLYPTVEPPPGHFSFEISDYVQATKAQEVGVIVYLVKT